MLHAFLIRHRRWFVSMALLAVLMNLLAPGLSQAMQAGASGGATAWLEVCSSTGSKWIKLDAADQILEQTSSRPGDAPTSDHEASCGYCLSHAASFALLGTAQPWGRPVLQGVFTRVATLEQRAPAAPPPWTRPALRAPPQA